MDRLYPVYMMGVALAIALSAARGALHHDTPPIAELRAIWSLPHSLPNASLQLFIAFTNLTMVFQDAAMFVVVRGGHAAISSAIYQSDFPVFAALAVPQAWSLGTELTFYGLAPFLLKLRSRWLSVVVAVALAAKAATLAQLPVDRWDPFSYRFFPFELAYFCLGAIGYRCCERFVLVATRLGSLARPLAYLLAVATVLGNRHELITFALFPVIAACIIPFVFVATSRIAVDRSIGDLSYPFYIFHWLLYDVSATAVRVVVGGNNQQLALWVAAVATALLSWVIVELEARQLEPRRAKFAQPTRAPPSGTLDAPHPAQET